MKQAFLMLLFALFAYGTHAQLCRPIASSKYTYENGIGTMADSYLYIYTSNRGAFNIPTGNITYDTCYHLIGIAGQGPAYVDQTFNLYNAADTVSFTQTNVWDPLYIWLPAGRAHYTYDALKHLTRTVTEGYWPWTDWFRNDSISSYYSGDILDSALSKKWVYAGTQQIPTYARFYTYDTLKRVVTSMTYTIDSATKTPFDRGFSSYGLNTDTTVSQRYDANTNGWNNNSKGILSRDTNQNVTGSQFYQWNTLTQKWDFQFEKKLVYNAYNQITSDTGKSSLNGPGFLFDEYQYINQLISNKITKLFDVVKQQWINQTQDSYTYTAHQLLENFYHRTWDTTTARWVNQYYTGTIYNANDQATSVTQFVGDSVLGWKRSKATYYYYEQFPVSISAPKKLTTLLLYPNPANDVLHCKFVTQGNYTLSIYDEAGRTILKRNGNNTAGYINIPVQYLSKGIYQLHIETSSTYHTGTFIKE